MKVFVGIDLGSTTTKAVLLDENGQIMGRGITNSRSNYEVACAVARDEAMTSARFNYLARALQELKGPGGDAVRAFESRLLRAFRLELYLDELAALRARMIELVETAGARTTASVREAVSDILDEMEQNAPSLFLENEGRRSDFFRDLAGAAFLSAAEGMSSSRGLRFEALAWPFDRAILDIETELRELDFQAVLSRAAERIGAEASGEIRDSLAMAVEQVGNQQLEEVSFVGTGYGRQTLPFPKAAVRSEILCHGRGAHRVFPGTRTVLDIGGQDTKAIQVDERGVVTAFQMNDRCAAGCGRYLGYIADELSLGLHELGPLALKSCNPARINSTCTVFAGAELRERLALGEKREDILAGLHRAIMLRAMSLLARSGGVSEEFTFTGGVCNNPMACRVLQELVNENYGNHLTINIHPDSIYMGALGAALFALDDWRAGQPHLLRVSQHKSSGVMEPEPRACLECA
jgi:benzoyl-CoA reductase subunit A